jgi:coronin-1B/1C/6
MQQSSTVKVFNLTTKTCIAMFEHPDKVVSFAIHPILDKLATFCKDGLVRVFEMRTGKNLNNFGSHDGGKSGRIVWLGEDDVLVSVGFNK